MQFITGCQMPSMSPDVVDTSLRVLQVYAMTQAEEARRDNENLLIDAASDCIRDYIMGVGRFGAPPPALSQNQQTFDAQQVENYLAAMAREARK